MLKNNLVNLFVVMFCLAVLYACAPSSDITDASLSETKTNVAFEAKLERALQSIRAEQMPAIVAYSHHNGDVQVVEFGALENDGIPADETQIDINSVTKTVTGVMAAKLVEQGQVSFTERLDEIFDNVPADKASITLHHLLTHSAGLIEVVGDDEERLGKAEFLDRAFNSELMSEPGSIYSYSNVGYSVVAAIIEERSGKSYDAFLQEDVIAGLGLPNTGYLSVYDDARSMKTANGETIFDASWGGHEPYWNLIGNGGLVSTVQEMVKFRRAVVSGEIISSETLEILQTPHIKEDDAATSFYGYGLVVQDYPELGRFYWHNGGNNVFSAQWGDYEDKGDILFTAGADNEDGNAFRAMETLEHHLYLDGDK